MLDVPGMDSLFNMEKNDDIYFYTWTVGAEIGFTCLFFFALFCKMQKNYKHEFKIH